jgi:hypothetical protein
MMSHTPTLLDPYEVATAVARAPLPSLLEPTEWFDRAALFIVEESNEVPPWTPEPVDRRWRARGWTDDD